MQPLRVFSAFQDSTVFSRCRFLMHRCDFYFSDIEVFGHEENETHDFRATCTMICSRTLNSRDFLETVFTRAGRVDS